MHEAKWKALRQRDKSNIKAGGCSALPPIVELQDKISLKLGEKCNQPTRLNWHI